MKYIIEIPDKDIDNYKLGNGEMTIPVRIGMSDFCIGIGTGINLVPYNEAEAEQRGAEESDTAEQGWELAKKISIMPDKDKEEVWGTAKYNTINFGYSYAEAKEKYDAWQKRKDELKIGDEVMHDAYRRCVLLEKKDIHEVELWSVIDEKGTVHQINGKHISRKTGRHFPQVVEMLEQMKEPE